MPQSRDFSRAKCLWANGLTNGGTLGRDELLVEMLREECTCTVLCCRGVKRRAFAVVHMQHILYNNGLHGLFHRHHAAHQ
jgi:hypothetical protein